MRQKQERTLAILCHLGAFVGFIVPFGNIIAPLVIWLLKKEESAFVNASGKGALNFQISMTIYCIVAAILIAVAIGAVLLPVLVGFNMVMVVMAAVKANRGEEFAYPLTIKFIK